MFTGIIETTGTLTAITPTGGDVQLTISAPSLILAMSNWAIPLRPTAFA